MKNTSYLSLIVVLAVILSGCGKSTEDPLGWETYQNREHRFSMEIPAAYQVTEPLVSDDAVSISFGDEKTTQVIADPPKGQLNDLEVMDRYTIEVYPNDDKYIGPTPEDELDQLIIDESYNPVHTEGEVGGYPYSQWEYVLTSDQYDQQRNPRGWGTEHTIYRFIYSDDDVYYIEAEAYYADDAETIVELFYRTVNSLRVHK